MVAPKSTKTSYSKVTISAIEFYKIYSVMYMRLSMGYSAYEQSFLLGKNDQFVRDVEDPLKSKRYNIDDTNYLLLIYDDHWRTIMPVKTIQDNYQLEVTSSPAEKRLPAHMIKKSTKETDLRSFDCFPDKASNEKLDVILVKQEEKHIELPTTKLLSSFATVKLYIDKLLEDKFFDEPKRALDVFRQCKIELGHDFHPRYMIKVLNYYTNKKSGVVKLNKDKRNDFGRTLFIKVN